ncbi:DUF4222 domain-containing protein [Escherichia coli]
MSEDIPLPKVGQRYRDDHGALVTVTSVEETRVVFMRDGYPHPCMQPMYNFLGKFKPEPRQEAEQPGIPACNHTT